MCLGFFAERRLIVTVKYRSIFSIEMGFKGKILGFVFCQKRLKLQSTIPAEIRAADNMKP